MTGDGERVTGERWQVGKGGARAGDPPRVRACICERVSNPLRHGSGIEGESGARREPQNLLTNALTRANPHE